MGKHTRGWDDLLAHAKFAYNKTPSKATKLSPFQVVYGQNPFTPLDLLPLPTTAKLTRKQAREQKRSRTFMPRLEPELRKAMSWRRAKLTSTEGMLNFSHGTWCGFILERKDSLAKEKLSSCLGQMAPLRF